MPTPQVELPDGNTRTYNAQTIQELKRLVAMTIGVDGDEVAILDPTGQPVPESNPPPQNTRVIPKPKWGNSNGN